MKEWDKFLYFVKLQLATGDYDAHIPFLKGLKVWLGLSDEQATWLGFLYMAYYTEGSMWAAYTAPGVKVRSAVPPLTLPITTQRRNLYGGRIGKHMEDLYRLPRPTFGRWLGACKCWSSLLACIGTVWGNGRWACYTTSELMTHLHPALEGVEPNSYEILESSGPRKGLAALGLEASEASAELVRDRLAGDGVPVPTSVLESLLCDWAGMNKGTFYAGRNIDRQQGRILDVEQATGRTFPELWAVRLAVFPHNTLGELNGWRGIDPKRLKLYRDAGTVPAAHEDRHPVRKRR